MLTPYRVIRNALDYPLRRYLRPRRPVREVVPFGFEAAIEALSPADQAEARRLVAAYGLAEFVERQRRRDVLENIFYASMLERAFLNGGVRLPPERVDAIDVGVSHWFYAPALHGVLRRFGGAREARLIGFETDPGRLYADGHTREDWANWFTRGLADVEFVDEDARHWRGEADVATMLFPFVFARDADRWGLPRSLFRPRELLGHVWTRLRPSGALVIANQGARERDEQTRLLAQLGVEPSWQGLGNSPFWRYDVDRWITVAIKPSGPSS